MTQLFSNYINGEWVSRDQTFENRNRANTHELIGNFVKGTAQDVNAAAAAAAAALPAWSALSGPARGNILFKAVDILDKKFENVAADMTREEGKTLPEAKGEVRRAINILRYFAGEGSRMPGMLVPSERDRVHIFALRKPIGVVGLVTPWNFPSAIPAWKLAPALIDRKSTRLNSSHRCISYAVFCLKKKKHSKPLFCEPKDRMCGSPRELRAVQT